MNESKVTFRRTKSVGAGMARPSEDGPGHKCTALDVVQEPKQLGGTWVDVV